MLLWRLIAISMLLAAWGPVKSESAQILGLFQHPGKSHFAFFRPIFEELAKRGHNVSMYSYFPLKKPLANYTDFVFEGMGLLTDVIDLKGFDSEWKPLGLPFKIPTYFRLHDWGINACRVAMNSPLIDQLLKSPQRYDLIILENFANDCMYAVAHLLGAPVIALSSCAIMPWHYRRMGTPFINSVMPMNFLPHTDEMTFIDRLNNFIHFHTVNFLYNFVTQPATDKLIRERFGVGLPPIDDIVKNTSLMLINQHHTLTGSYPYAPSVVEVGGLQIAQAEELPAHFKSLFKRSHTGIVVISWGSMINPTTLPAAKRRALFDSISSLDEYSFVMRWANGAPPEDKPQNLHTFDWLPQRDLLCHPQVKAFISHGGLMGTTEAVHCGVPILATPFYGDQFLNAATIAKRGFGVIVDYREFDTDHITKALHVILDKNFADNVKRLSQSFRQRPQAPMDLAIWWIEEVIASKGSPQLLSQARYNNWFVQNSIDVYLCLLGIVWLLGRCIRLVSRLIRRVLALGRRKPDVENKMKQH
ncbi:uncharacterized protein Dwil_GK14590 [Drosophila willistoni]|nr:uncharacterized protein Dwil_GK14590 [Drosophila willistoni]